LTDATITDSSYPAGVHTFVSGVTNAITAGGGASGTFTAASGTTYNPATGVLVIEIGSHSLTTSNTVTIADGGVVFTCDADNNTLQTGYPRSSDPASGQALAITAETATTITVNVGVAIKVFTPTGATYDAATGDMVLTSASHGLVGPTTSTPTGATYTATTGVMTLTISNHGYSNGDKVQIVNNGLTFSCTSDGNTLNKTYPRRSDPGSLGWLKISNVTTNTFDIPIGTSLDDYYTVSAATYDPNTNRTVLTIGDHELRPGTSIKLQNESLTWTCATDSNATEHSYPRSGDGNYDTSLPILNNGSSHDVSTATYNATTGVLVLTALKGTISNSAVTTIGTGYATATNVALTGGTGSGAIISITSVGSGTGDIVEYAVTNAGTGYSKTDVLTVSGGNGDARITVSQIAHGWSVGDKIRVEDDALTFTCDQDNNYTNHT